MRDGWKKVLIYSQIVVVLFALYVVFARHSTKTTIFLIALLAIYLAIHNVVGRCLYYRGKTNLDKLKSFESALGEKNGGLLHLALFVILPLATAAGLLVFIFFYM